MFIGFEGVRPRLTPRMGDLPLRLFVRGCARASAAQPLVCPYGSEKGDQLGLLQPGLLKPLGNLFRQSVLAESCERPRGPRTRSRSAGAHPS
jgi:hypothetical protein